MLTKYGLPQVIVYPAIIAAAMVVIAAAFGRVIWLIPAEIVLFVVFIWLLSFFRNPPRRIEADDSVLYSPCDGTVTEIDRSGGSIRVSMFLSLFNVHINRAPCGGVVENVTYKRGEYRDARDPDSARLNESNELRLACPSGDIVAVRQVSGAVARHIVCKAGKGDVLRQGEPFGMIKFGSRTEIIISNSPDCEICVEIGSKVKAGITVLARYN